MAYTYSDAIKKIKDAGLYKETSEYDKALLVKNPDFADSIIKNKTGYKNAASDEERKRYNDLLNADRALQGGYSGGRTGMEYNTTGNSAYSKIKSVSAANTGTAAQGGSGFSAQGNLTYPASLSQISYSDPYAAVIGSYLTPSKSERFSYNYKSDPTYQALYAAALKNGEISGKNTLARAAAMTGGAPSTYAVQAATAAENQALNDVAFQIPSLEAAAYQRYANERDFNENQRLNMLSTYMNLDNTAYGRYRDEISDRRYEDETAYGRQWNEKEWDYNVEQNDRERALKEAQMIAELTGDYTKFAEILGVSPDSINMYQASLAANSSSGAKKSSGGSGSSSSKQGSAGGYQGAIGSDSWYQYMYRQYGDDAYYKILNEYKDAGISSKSQAQELALAFKEWSDNWKKEKTGTMMTKSEWARHKNSGSDYWGSEAPTYEDYVDVYRSFYGV